MKQTKNIITAFLFVFVLAFAGAGSALAQASVTTDKSDYAPESTAIITGSGFQAGETVKLQVLRIDIDENSGPEHDPWAVTADANGGFQTTWYVTSDEFGATLELTATGETSGLIAKAVFTDAVNFTFSITAGQSPNPVCAGSGANYTVTVTPSGNPSSVTVTYSASGLPSGVTASFSPPSATFSGNTAKTTTMTLNTPANSGGTYNNITITGTATGAGFNPTTTSLVVSSTSNGGTATPAASPVCSGSAPTINLSGQVGSVTKWQYSSDNFASDVHDIANTTTTLNNAPTITATTYYRAVVQNSPCTTANSSVATVTVQSVSATPVVSSPICAGSTSVSGTSTEANGTTITVYDNAGSVGTTTVSGNAWTKTGLTLTAGHTMTATAQASSKCVSAVSSGVTVQSVTATPVVSSPICTGSTTISGTSENGASITVYKAGTTQIGTATANGSGAWTATVSAVAASDSITATALTSGKCVSLASSAVVVQSVTTTPVVSSPICAGSTTVSGTSENGASITVYKAGTTQIGTATANGSGAWTATVSAVAASDSITATALTSGKCVSLASSAVVVQSVTTTPVVSSPICAGSTTVSGTSENGASITVYKAGTTQIGTATANGSGAWTATVSAVAASDSITATALTSGKCVSLASSAVVVQSVTTTPVVSSPICAGSTTVSGTSENGASITVYKAGTTQIGTATANGSGAWTATVSAVAASDSITATALTSGKCVSLASSAVVVQSVTTTPVVSSPICAGSTTVSGTSENGASITVYKAGTTQIGTATANGSGAWTATVSAVAASDSITATALTSGKCVSLASSAVVVQSVTTTPVVSSPICAGSTAVSGTSENGASITVYKAGTTQIGTATANGSGAWTATVSAVAASDSITATALTSGKCLSAVSAGVTVSAASVGGTATPAATPVCSGSAPTINLTGQTGNVTKWQYSSVSDFSSDVHDIANTTATLNNAPTITATTYYRAVMQSGACSSDNSSVATVTVTADAPSINNVTATQGGNNVKDCALTLSLGTVSISFHATGSGTCPVTGTSVRLTNGVNTVDLVVTGPSGDTYNCTWDVTGATAHGEWYATVIANTSAGSQTNQFTLCFAEVAGQTSLGSLAGSSATVTFVATDAAGGILNTWAPMILSLSGGSSSFTLPDVPGGTAYISARTPNYLRQRVPVGTLSFSLFGGDANNDGQVNATDYATVRSHWMQNVPAGTLGDINGDGVVNNDDYGILKNGWYHVQDNP